MSGRSDRRRRRSTAPSGRRRARLRATARQRVVEQNLDELLWRVAAEPPEELDGQSPSADRRTRDFEPAWGSGRAISAGAEDVPEELRETRVARDVARRRSRRAGGPAGGSRATRAIARAAVAGIALCAVLGTLVASGAFRPVPSSDRSALFSAVAGDPRSTAGESWYLQVARASTDGVRKCSPDSWYCVQVRSGETSREL